MWVWLGAVISGNRFNGFSPGFSKRGGGKDEFHLSSTSSLIGIIPKTP